MVGRGWAQAYSKNKKNKTFLILHHLFFLKNKNKKTNKTKHILHLLGAIYKASTHKNLSEWVCEWIMNEYKKTTF